MSAGPDSFLSAVSASYFHLWIFTFLFSLFSVLPPPAAIFTSIHTCTTFTTPPGSQSFLVELLLQPAGKLRICGICDWICLWGPEVMTGVRRHLLECWTGLPCFGGVIPSFHFSADFPQIAPRRLKATTKHHILAQECL